MLRVLLENYFLLSEYIVVELIKKQEGLAYKVMALHQLPNQYISYV